MNSNSWKTIFDKYKIQNHNFDSEPFIVSAEMIKLATQHFTKTNEKEVRILCKQDSREDRPEVFVENNLFLLPTRNGEYAIVKGEGYIDIPEIQEVVKVYNSKLDFKLDTSLVGNSEMQHLDFAYASSLIRTFFEDDSLVLTIRGRKYTPIL
jgi:predicted Ser/Thr protein kinase